MNPSLEGGSSNPLRWKITLYIEGRKYFSIYILDVEFRGITFVLYESSRWKYCFCHCVVMFSSIQMHSSSLLGFRTEFDGNVIDIWTVFISLADFLLKVDSPLRYYLAFFTSFLYPYSPCEAQRSADQKIKGLLLLWICWRNRRRL